MRSIQRKRIATKGFPENTPKRSRRNHRRPNNDQGNQQPLAHRLSARRDFAEEVLDAVLDEHFAGGQHLLHCADGQFWYFDGRKWTPLRPELFDNAVLKTLEGIPHSQRTTSLISQTGTGLPTTTSITAYDAF